ncbi:translation initiation factor IF-2-like [Sorex araneus]|uniref:translation initiation factor IF-2-like n=1 Tax=Sorex araneus TaxID=42254 RepID=UPI0024337444|nr:translation initiation factor IF-2-like [Sorex araneus]
MAPRVRGWEPGPVAPVPAGRGRWGWLSWVGAEGVKFLFAPHRREGVQASLPALGWSEFGGSPLRWGPWRVCSQGGCHHEPRPLPLPRWKLGEQWGPPAPPTWGRPFPSRLPLGSGRGGACRDLGAWGWGRVGAAASQHRLVVGCSDGHDCHGCDFSPLVGVPRSPRLAFREGLRDRVVGSCLCGEFPGVAVCWPRLAVLREPLLAGSRGRGLGSNPGLDLGRLCARPTPSPPCPPCSALGGAGSILRPSWPFRPGPGLGSLAPESQAVLGTSRVSPHPRCAPVPGGALGGRSVPGGRGRGAGCPGNGGPGPSATLSGPRPGRGPLRQPLAGRGSEGCVVRVSQQRPPPSRGRSAEPASPKARRHRGHHWGGRWCPPGGERLRPRPPQPPASCDGVPASWWVSQVWPG